MLPRRVGGPSLLSDEAHEGQDQLPCSHDPRAGLSLVSGGEEQIKCGGCLFPMQATIWETVLGPAFIDFYLQTGSPATPTICGSLPLVLQLARTMSALLSCFWDPIYQDPQIRGGDISAEPSDINMSLGGSPDQG